MPGWNPAQWDEFIDTAGTLAPPVALAPPPLGQVPMGLVDPFAGAPVPPDAQQVAAPAPEAQAAPPTLSPEEEAQIEIDQQPPAAPAGPDLGEMPVDYVGQPLNVDATSAAAPIPQPDVYTGPGQTSGQPEMPVDYLSDEDYGGYLASLPAEKQIIERAKIEGAKQRFATARALDASDKAVRQAEDNARIYQDSVKAAQQHSMDLDVEAKKIAAENPLDTISGTRKVFGVLASIIGGFVQNKTGRNPGLEMVESIANDAAAQHAQKLQLNARQQAGIGDQVARANDVYRAAEAVRLAVYDGAIKTLEAEVQNFDPRGTTALRVMDDINAAKARRAELLQKYTIEQQKRIEEALKLQRENAQLLETNRHNVAGEQTDRTRAYTDLVRAQADKARAEAEGPGSAKGRKAEAEATKAEAEAEAAKSGYAIKNPESGAVIKNPDGTAVVEMDATKRNRVSGMIEAAQNIRRLADRMAELKKKYGGASETLGSEEAQELKNLASMIDFETFKAFDLGAPSEGDKALAEGVRGGVDPTSFVKNATPGFQAYADAVEKKANTALRNSGYTGPALKFHRASDLKKTAPSVVDQWASVIAKSEYDDYDPNNPAKYGLRLPPLPNQVAANKKVDEALQGLASFAEQPGDQGDAARRQLKELAARAVSPVVRTKVKALIETLPGQNVRGDEAR